MTSLDSSPNFKLKGSASAFKVVVEILRKVYCYLESFVLEDFFSCH